MLPTRNPTPGTRNPRSGFTLIELLVVISIVALLIALLLPAVKRAKQTAHVVACGSNLRQLVIALWAYSHENDGQGPAYSWDDSSDLPGPTLDPGEQTVFWYGGQDYDHVWWGTTSWVERAGRRKLNPYTDGFEGYRCPADTGKVYNEVQGGRANTNKLWEHSGTSYNYNASWRGTSHYAHKSNIGQSPHVFYGQPFETFGETSIQILIGDATMQYTWPVEHPSQGPHHSEFNWHDPPSDHPEATSFWPEKWYYDPKSNIGFLDGHVSFIRLGPHERADYSVNTATYILDPKMPR